MAAAIWAAISGFLNPIFESLLESESRVRVLLSCSWEPTVWPRSLIATAFLSITDIYETSYAEPVLSPVNPL